MQSFAIFAVRAMGWLRNWASRAPSVKWWTPCRPLRLATDCSGLGIPEIAADMLAGSERSVHVVFACDVWGASQQWLAKMGASSVILGDMNLRIWDVKAGKITTRDYQGKPVRISKEQADLDIYVCGFMCTPFTPNGDRAGWNDENAKTFWSSLKTIITLRPRVFVLENVKAISNNSNSEVVEKAMGKLSGYVVLTLKVDSKDYGIPHHRPRVYIVGLQTDTLPAALKDKDQSILTRLLQARLAKAACQTEPEHFPSFLSALREPIVPSLQSSQSESESEEEAGNDKSNKKVCTCDVNAVCQLHVCQCKKCIDFGVAKKKCLWRQTLIRCGKSARAVIQRREYLKQWRKLRKNPKLKHAPTYFELAEQRGLATGHIKQPAKRCMLLVASRQQNIMSKNAIMNIGKTFGRHQFRKDGFVPTLGHGCTTFFLPGFAQFLTIPQLLCLSGFHPTLNKKVFELARDMKPTDMGLFIGNSMCVPVVGHVMAVSLGIISPSCPCSPSQ